MFKLLSTANPKIQKGTKLGYLSFILHLAPSDLSGKNTCPKATAGCAAACLNTAGRGGMFKKGENTNMIQKAGKFAEKQGLTPVIRLNGTSDLAWEKYSVPVFCTENIFELFPNVQFYDYTKVLGRKVKNIPNYHLTFSKADGNDADVAKAIEQGYNIAAVFDEMPAEYMGLPVINADETDLRFLDPKGCIAGLKAKGRAKKDYSGFVIRLKEVA